MKEEADEFHGCYNRRRPFYSKAGGDRSSAFGKTPHWRGFRKNSTKPETGTTESSDVGSGSSFPLAHVTKGVTLLLVIRTFRHRDLQRYFETGKPKGIPSEMRKRIQIRLNVLDRAKELRDLDLPGLDFHPLRGDRKGEFAIKVSGNYRLTFRFESGDVADLNLEDYH